MRSAGHGETSVWTRLSFTDTAAKPDAGPLQQRYDYGTFALAVLGGADHTNASAQRDALNEPGANEASEPHGQPLIGTLGKSVKLAPGESKTVTFIVAWHFPNLNLERMGKVGRCYAARFNDASAVAEHVAASSESFYNQDPSVGRYLVRFDAAVLAARPHDGEHLDAGHDRLLSVS